MPASRASRAPLLLAASLLLLPGCGPAIVAGAVAAGIAAARRGSDCDIPGVEVEVAVSGTVRFQKRPADPRTGVEEVRPARGVRVEVLRLNCGEEVVASADTDEDGSYAVAFRTPSGSILRVAALARRFDPASPAAVMNNQRERLVYSVESADISLTEDGSQSFPQDLDAPIDCSLQTAGAFNILDALRLGFAAVADHLDAPPRPLTVFWSLGNPEGAFFNLSTADLDGDGAGGDPFIQLRGGAVISGCHNTDHFDDAVILHEFGHYLGFVHSRDDSPGGPHSIAELVDPRLAWSEGWADFISGLVRGSPLFVDTLENVEACSGPCGAFDFSLDTKPASCSPARCCLGPGSEEAVGAFLWDLLDPAAEAGDGVQLAAGDLLLAFERLRQRRFVYAGDFIEEIEEIAAGLVPPRALAVRALAAREGMTGPDGGLLPFPSAFDSETREGEQASAFASGSVDGCGADVCKSNVESFLGASDFYEFQIPGSPPAGGRLRAELTFASATSGACSSELELRIFDASQSRLYTTAGRLGFPKAIELPFDAEFQRGSYILVEVAGDSGEGQGASYGLSIEVP